MSLRVERGTQARPTGKTARQAAVRVLVADDDGTDQLLMAMAADEANVGVELTFKDDGAELLVYLASIDDPAQLPDLIVLDLNMPVLGGHETLERLQTHPILGQVPVIVFSSSTLASDRHRSFERGANWYEIKPSDFAGMVAFVGRVAERGRVAHEDLEALTSDPAAQLCLSALAADAAADVEDELLLRGHHG